MIVPVILLIMVQVLLSAILSIPFLFIYRLFKRVQVLELVLIIALVVGLIVAAVNLINLIPETIDLDVQWPSMVSGFENFILGFDRYIYPLNQLHFCQF